MIKIKSAKKLTRWIYGHWGHDRFMDHEIMIKSNGSWENTNTRVKNAYVFTYGSVLRAAEELQSKTGLSMMDAVSKIVKERLTALANGYFIQRRTDKNED